MNIFVLDNCPMKAAQAIDCVRVPGSRKRTDDGVSAAQMGCYR
jgi:hypothetical protein